MKQQKTVGIEYFRENYGVKGVHQVEAITDIAASRVETCAMDIIKLARKTNGPLSTQEVVYEVALPVFVKEALTGYILATLLNTLHMKDAPSNAPEIVMNTLHTVMERAMSDALQVLMRRTLSEEEGDG